MYSVPLPVETVTLVPVKAYVNQGPWLALPMFSTGSTSGVAKTIEDADENWMRMKTVHVLLVPVSVRHREYRLG